ncbi:Zn(2)-C6 fungal-type domain-containing protein [Fusarium falciforme]|uniref:Zn(2)-C6 fungal-type domain-containing protein n=1 Tax=Fusarium falciforme TaxID=195108 RepID=UPI002301D49A|nr:Zn(2)-C6 fungal-type domain-containing protein [Fusarium falciforme]WAO96876.1 Zn(2)-C6 fungal-type domain-containing protein [Fusarium falciforme]
MELQTELLFLKNCPLCEKVYRQEHSYNRHIKYCQRAQSRRKGRPRSCISCSKAKAKCTFGQPCSRCGKKDLACIYDQSSRRQANTEVLWTGNGNNQQVSQMVLASSNDFGSSFDLDVFRLDPNLAEYTVSSLPVPDTAISTQRSVQEDLQYQEGNSQAQVTVKSLSAKADLTRLPYQREPSHHAAKLVLQTLYAFPQMMLRRKTFPPFIHPQWHEPCLPEALANCMSIAQLFAARTPETRAFLWRTINTEEQRFRENYMSFSAREIQMAVQSLMIYMIMAIIDQDEQTKQRGTGLLDTVETLSSRFLTFVGSYSQTERAEPSLTWEDWIFAESRRRMSSLWIVISAVIFIDNNIPCRGCGPLEHLPLLSSKMLWEAQTREEWQLEKTLYDVGNPVMTLGALVKAKRNPEDPLHAQELQCWEAGTDKLAIMLDIATQFVWAR